MGQGTRRRGISLPAFLDSVPLYSRVEERATVPLERIAVSRKVRTVPELLFYLGASRAERISVPGFNKRAFDYVHCMSAIGPALGRYVENFNFLPSRLL